MSANSSASSPLREPTPLDWEQQREFITNLWEKRHTRKYIQDELAKKGLFVTPKMILTRTKNWHLDRNNKEHEMAAAARMLRERGAIGKTRSVVLIRRRRLDEAELHRYAKRRRMTVNDLARLAQSPTPDAVVCRSPTPEAVASCSPMPRAIALPEVYRVPQSLLRGIHEYTYNQVISLNRDLAELTIWCNSKSVRFPGLEAVYTILPFSSGPFFTQLEDAYDSLRKWQWSGRACDLRNGTRLIGSALDDFPVAMCEPDIGFMWTLTKLTRDLFVDGFQDIARIFLHYLYKCSSELRNLHRYSPLFRSFLSALELDGFVQLTTVMALLIHETIENDLSTLLCRFELTWLMEKM